MSQSASPAPARLTPMFAQYARIKEQYADALLFFRMGDFYELFFEDAEVAARELQIALTSRNPQSPDPVPMCGVPWHAAESYIGQLVDKGHKVAICDQVEDPKTVKGLVERAVVRVHTAATVVEDSGLEAKGHSFLAALYWNNELGAGGIAWVDVSTGYWTGLQTKKSADLWQWAQKIAPRELLLPENGTPPPCSFPDTQVVRVPLRSHFDPKRASERIRTAQGVAELGALGLEQRKELMQACGALLAYLEQTQMQNTRHLAPFKPLDPAQHLILDEVTERNLELFRRLDGRKGPGTLRQVIDATMTPMGGRQLEERLRHPWRDAERIRDSQDVVAWLVEHGKTRAMLREKLKIVYDLERLSTRIAINRTSPKDFLALRQSLAALPQVREALSTTSGLCATDEAIRQKNLPPALLCRLMRQWDDMDDCACLLERALADDPPVLITEGGLFRPGYDPDLDKLLDLVEHGEGKLQKLLQEEQVNARLPKLKLGYNRVFGYYFELGKTAGNVTPAHFIRRQTLANAERFTTPALSELEEQLLSASDRRKQLEYKLFQQLREEMTNQRERIVFMASLLAHLDYWQSLAETAARWGWNRPELHEEGDITIIEGRHPVVEVVQGKAAFVPNDLRMDSERRLILITGPNMAGKSTVLRQTALICILAQMGSFVPAKTAVLGVCDRIFSRVGASDNLAQGQSTFMVEMMETARILRQATRRSLIILDEIGRGTSTFDGLALAWSVVENLIRRAGGGIRTLFATHYHELTALESTTPGLHNMNIAVQEWNNEIVFLRRLVPGPTDRSYGIEVARLAGVPSSVVQRAREILHQLEQTKHPTTAAPPSTLSLLPGFSRPEPPAPKPAPVKQPLHPLLTTLRDLNPDDITPLTALKLVCEWKTLWGNNREPS